MVAGLLPLLEYCRITRLASTSAAKSGQGRVMIMWRKWLVLGVLVVLLASSAICEASAAVPLHWMRYTTADGLVSFEYPSGWLVVETESGFMIHDEYDTQQLWLVALPYQRSWSAKEHADYFLGLLQAENPDVYGGDWQSDQSGDMILMELTDRKSTRLNSSHVKNSYAVVCLNSKRPRRPATAG